MNSAFTGAVNKVSAINKMKAAQPETIEREQTFEIPSIKLDTPDTLNAPQTIPEDRELEVLEPIKLPAVGHPTPDLGFLPMVETERDTKLFSDIVGTDGNLHDDGLVTLRDIEIL